jgi:hypothetical protein
LDNIKEKRKRYKKGINDFGLKINKAIESDLCQIWPRCKQKANEGVLQKNIKSKLNGKQILIGIHIYMILFIEELYLQLVK